MTPQDIATRYPGLATGATSAKAISDLLGVTRHTVRIAVQLAKDAHHYKRGVVDAQTAKTQKPVDILVIPDAHVMPGEDLRRFTWLGSYAGKCADRALRGGRDFYLVSIGDFNDVHSLSSWDKGKASGENSRYSKDCEANIKALGLIREAMGAEAYRRTKKVITLGNHENRINRFADDNPSMHGFLDPGKDLGFLEHGWKVVPFLAPYCINGAYFVHYVQNGAGRAMSGVTLVRRLVSVCHETTVVGHTHKYRHYVERTPLTGKRLHGIEVGCFFEAAHSFAGTMGNNQYDRQLLLLQGVSYGDFDLTTISMKSLQEECT